MKQIVQTLRRPSDIGSRTSSGQLEVKEWSTSSTPEAQMRALQIKIGSLDADDPPDTVKLLNPLHGKKLPSRGGTPLQGRSRANSDAVSVEHPPSISNSQDTTSSNNSNNGSGGLGNVNNGALPATEEVWQSLRDPLKGVKLTTKKRRLKTIDNCFSGKDAIEWLLARYPRMTRTQGQYVMQQLLDQKFLVPASKSSPLVFEDSESCLLRMKMVNDNAGFLTLTVKEAAGLLDKATSDIYCNVDVKYKKSELSLASNHWKTQMAKGPNPKWNATFKVPSRVQPQHLQFEAQVFAKNPLGATFLGQVEIPLDSCSGGDLIEEWIPLQMRRQGEEVRGELLVSLCFTSLTEDEKSGTHRSTSSLSSSQPEMNEDLKKDDAGLVDVADPLDMLAEIPYEFDNPELAGEVMFEKLPTGAVDYKAASLVKLVEILTSELPQGSSIVDDVLLTYPTFTTGLRLFNLFLKRYLGPPEGGEGPVAEHQVKVWNLCKKDVQNRVGSVLARWMTASPDFSENAQLFSYLKKVVDANIFDPTPSLSKYFAKKFDECRKKRLGLDAPVGTVTGSSTLAPSGTLRMKGSLRPELSAVTTMRQVALLDLNTDEIAEQMTLIEHELFRAIEPVELLNQNWNKHPELSPHVIEYIQWFNKMCQWSATEIIKEDNPESRAVIISKFIHIADRLAQLNNFNGLMEILASLEGASIRRLKLSWAEIPPGDAETLERLAALMKPEKNFKDYRAAIVNSAGKPWIPYLGLHLTDLTFVDDGNTTFVGGNNNLVNLQKSVMTAQCVRTVVDSAKIEFYGVRPMMGIQKLLVNVTNTVFDDNEVYRLSLLREARNAGGDAADRGRGNRNRLANIAKSMMKRTNVAAEKELTDADWGVVLEGSRTVVFMKDQVIIRQGQLNTRMYMIQTGRVRVEKLAEGKTEPLVLTTMEPPKVFGEMSIIMPNNKPAVSCVADIDGMKLYETDYAELHKAFVQHPDLARRFYMTMAKKLSEMLIALVPPTTKKKEDSVGGQSSSDADKPSTGEENTEEGSDVSQGGTLKKKKKKKKKPVAEGDAASSPGGDGTKVRRRKTKKKIEGRPSASQINVDDMLESTEPGTPGREDTASSSDAVPSNLPKSPPPPPPTEGGAADGSDPNATGAAATPTQETPVKKIRKKKLVRKKRKPQSARTAPIAEEGDNLKFGKLFGIVVEGPSAEKFIGRFEATFKRYQGKLVLFERSVCFLSEMFMTTTKRVFPLSRFQRVEKRADGVSLATLSTDIVFTFSAPEVAETVFATVQGLWNKVERTNEDMTDEGVQIAGATDDDLLEVSQKQILTPSDWDLMLNGAKKVLYQDGEFIIRAGESYQKIYHIVRGTCIVEVERDGQPVVINRMQENTTFGEMSFIKQTEDNEYKASASVIAVDEVELSIIEGYFINVLFDLYPGLDLRFFEYLCSVLANRIHKQTIKFGGK